MFGILLELAQFDLDIVFGLLQGRGDGLSAVNLGSVKSDICGGGIGRGDIGRFRIGRLGVGHGG